jgi:RHS repeat-associated protein
MTDPQNGVTSYIYDTLNRLSTLTPPTAFGTGSFGFTYDALSRRTQMTRPNGVTSNYTYNNLSQLLSVLHQVGASTIDGAVYTVDPAGNRTAKTDKHANVTSNYTYDPLYELTQVTQSTTTTETYSYDPVGNRLSSLGISPYTVNTSNELSTIPGTTYTYDNNGNILTKVVGSNTTNYAWDFENRLTSVTLPGSGGTVSFKSDPFGKRIEKTTSSTTGIYAYDGINSIEEDNAAGGVVARYTLTENVDEPLAMLRSSTTSYYEQDGLGSVSSLSNAAGALAQTYTYDSFGNQTASSGSLTNFFRYTAREFDTETSLYYLRTRYYDPSTARFVSEDSIRFSGGIDFYAYAENRPLYFIDPLGTCPEPNRRKVCAENYYGIGTVGTRLGTLLAAAPIPKSWFGLPSALGSGTVTTLPSVFSLGAGTAASGSNVLRLAGRVAGPVAIAGVLVDTAALALCTSNAPLPSFLYTITKYDPF